MSTSKNFGREQGDHIGRIFADWAFVFFGQFFLFTEVAQNPGLMLYLKASYVIILKKGLGYLLYIKAIFSQTHLVTLVESFLSSLCSKHLPSGQVQKQSCFLCTYLYR
jgi:hypothetical protein